MVVGTHAVPGWFCTECSNPLVYERASAETRLEMNEGSLWVLAVPCACGNRVFSYRPELPKKMPANKLDNLERVNHPSYYGGDTMYEAIKVIEAWQLNFCLGNAVKYICRFGKKDDRRAPVEDLRKAAWYLNREIERLEKQGENKG